MGAFLPLNTLNSWEFKIIEMKSQQNFSTWCMPSIFQRKAASMDITEGRNESREACITIIVLQAEVQWLISLQTHWKSPCLESVRTVSYWLSGSARCWLSAARWGQRKRTWITKKSALSAFEDISGDTCTFLRSWIKVKTCIMTVIAAIALYKME